MSTLTLVAIVQTAMLVGSTNNYTAAHKLTTETGRPLVVLVGAKWCPACQVMKKDVMPEVVRKGLYSRCVYTVVDLDEQRKLGQDLTQGGPIPQLIMFRKTSEGWSRRKLIGGQSVSTVVNFIDEGIKLDELEETEAAGADNASSGERHVNVAPSAAEAQGSS